ncbi:hypothetical protein HY214_02725 [Candidatus Roizmanbacteria bacterium]|nr:hypothetical protein [Candidatus Roizmanbacteria bacterium]
MNQPKQKTNLPSKNPLETFKELGSSTIRSAGDGFKNLGSGIFDQFFGDYDNPPEKYRPWETPAKPPEKKKKEFSLFNYQNYYEKELIKKEIKELAEIIKREIALIKKADASLLNSVKDVEKLTIDTLPEKPGVYHLRFLEAVLNLLRVLRAKIGESRTWLQAMISKRKKRGSLFANLSKKKGTQYSLSQELQATRSVQ